MLTPTGKLATVTETLSGNDFLLKYDTVPHWMPVAISAEETRDSSFVYMRKDFIEKYCKEWNL